MNQKLLPDKEFCRGCICLGCAHVNAYAPHWCCIKHESIFCPCAHSYAQECPDYTPKEVQP